MKLHLIKTKKDVKDCFCVPADVVEMFKKLLSNNKQDKKQREESMYEIERPDYFNQSMELRGGSAKGKKKEKMSYGGGSRDR